MSRGISNLGGGGGLTQEEHDALMSMASMPARGDFNPLKESADQWEVLYNNAGSGSITSTASVNVIGYDKISLMYKNQGGSSAPTYKFLDAAGNEISSITASSSGTWTAYEDVPSNAVCLFVTKVLLGNIYASLLTADSPYNPDDRTP